MGDHYLILALFVMTAVAALIVGFAQLAKVRKAKREHHHTAVTNNRPDLRS